MKKLIKEVLDDLKYSQVNLESKSSREMIANLISAALKAKGSYKEYTDYDIDEQKARASWVCAICGKSTYELDYDYVGSGANHLSCELRLEQDENYRKKDQLKKEMREKFIEKSNKNPVPKQHERIRREKNWSQKKHEDKVFNEYVEDIDDQAYAQGRRSSKADLDSDENIKLRNEVFEKQKQLFEDAGDGTMLKVDEEKEKMKLVEEIIEGQEGKWIYESPDGGKTVFRRPFSNYDPKYKEEINWETKEPTGRVFTQYPFPPSSNSDEE